MPGTGVGGEFGVWAPARRPQHSTAPPCTIAHVWSANDAMSVAPDTSSTTDRPAKAMVHNCQQATVPFARSAHVEECPAVMATASSMPGITDTGDSGDGPTSQHSTDPSELSAQLPLSVAVTATAWITPLTRTGTGLLLREPSPSWP